MDAPLAARFKLEVLNRIRDVGLSPVDPRLMKCPVEELTCRTDEGTPDEILLIAWLFTDDHQCRTRRAFAEHKLGGWLPQPASATILSLSRNAG